MFLQNLLNWLNRIEQTAAVATAILPANHGILRLDQTLVYQRMYVLLHSFSAHPDCRTDGGVAGPALSAPHTFLILEVDVHQQLTGFETQLKYRIGQREHRIEHLASDPDLLLGYPATAGRCAAILLHFG